MNNSLTASGPSAFGKIPNFTHTIFPEESIPNLTLVANVGMIMFLFIVGLEVDIHYVVKNIKPAVTVGLGSIVIPFGIGAALSVGLYKNFATDEVSFGIFLLFIGLSMAVTEFPVLARILSEIGMLRERVGIIVIAAGVGNDLVSWILLALAVTLSNSSKAINTLYIILLTAAWILVLAFVACPLLKRYLRYSGGIENGPSESDMAILLILVFVSSFYTDIIGVHSIFGAFLVGVIIPRQNSFVVKVTEKIEDFISVILLPLYFTVAGLEIDLGLLSDGKTGGYIIAIIVIAIFSKLLGVAIPAKIHGLRWRESLAVGSLMSCKGAVEIVILQIGLHAGILTEKLFSMLVLMAIVTTFLTAPVTLKIYPVWYREKVSLWRNKEINWDGSPTVDTRRSSLSLAASQELYKFRKILIVLEDVHSMSATLILTQLLAAPKEIWEYEHDSSPNDLDNSRKESEISASRSREPNDLIPTQTQASASGNSTHSTMNNYNIHVFGIRLVELSQRTAPLIQLLSENQDQSDTDPILKVFRIFAGVNQISFSGKVALTTSNDRSHFIISMASSANDFVVITWEDTSFLEGMETSDGHHRLATYEELFTTAKNPIGLLIDRGFSLAIEPHVSRRIYIPFFGGEDSKQALATALHLASNAHVSVIIDVFSAHTMPLQEPAALESSSFQLEDLELNYVDLVMESYHSSLASRVKVHKHTGMSLEERKLRVMKVFHRNPRKSDLVILGRSDVYVELSKENQRGVVGRNQESGTKPHVPNLEHHLPEQSKIRQTVVGELASQYMSLRSLQCSFLVCQAEGKLTGRAPLNNV